MIRRTVLVFFLFMGTLFSQPALLKDGQIVVMMGNSITELGEKPDGYVNILRKSMAVMYPQMRVYFVNAGISGHKSTDMAARWKRDVLDYHADWVVISVGVNDVWHGFLAKELGRTDLSAVPLSVYKEKVIDMVQRAQAQKVNVAIMTATVIKENLQSPENKALEPYNQALREIAKKYQCLLIDQDAAFRKALAPHQRPGMADHGKLTTDGVHLSSSGNRLMAKTILKAFGVSPSQLEIAQPLIEAEIDKDYQLYERNLARYVKINHEVGSPCENEQRIVFYGSSSVEMWNLAKAFPDIPFFNRGIGGETSRQMWLRFGQDVAALKPTAVIIFLGSCNDFWPDVRMNVAETKANLARMARMVDKMGAKLAIGAIMPVNDYLPGKDYVSSHPIATVQMLNQWIQDFCRDNGYTFIDFYRAVADDSGKLDRAYTDDGMHCNATGYERWQPLVRKVIEEWGFGSQPRTQNNHKASSLPKALSRLIGNWQGTKEVQQQPDASVLQSKSTASVQTEAMGKFLSIRYSWRYENKDQQGLIIFGYDSEQNLASACWIDSWHMADRPMFLSGICNSADTLTVIGSYPAPEGPNWGWKIHLIVKNNHAFEMLMYNIPPEHPELLAVRAEYHRN